MRNASRRTQYALMIFFILGTAYTYFCPKINWNSYSRIGLTYAMVADGAFYIDTFHKLTGDKILLDDHYYTDKSIGPSIVAVPALYLYKLITGSLYLSNDTLPVIYTVTTWLAVSLPSALFGVMLFLFMSRFTPKLWYAVLATLAYGLGTITFPFSLAIFQHQLAAIGLFSTFIILWHIIYEDGSPGWLWVVGILTGLIVISDYFSGLLMGLILLWALYKLKNLRSIPPIVLGALPSLFLFFVYNTVCFGAPLTLGYSFQSEWSAVQGQGFFGLTHPTFRSLWGITFSSFRGLFYISPYLLLGFHGLYVMWRERFDRSIIILFLIVIGLTFFYGASYVMWWGGWSNGPRHIIPMLPFLAFPILFSFNYWMRKKWARLVIFLLVILSFANVWIQTLATNTYMPDLRFGIPSNVTSLGEWIMSQYELNYLYNDPVGYAITAISEGDLNDTLLTSHWKTENLATVLLPLFSIWSLIFFGFLISLSNPPSQQVTSSAHQT